MTSKIKIHPTAYIDPSCVLSGEIIIGKWSRLGPGTVIDGSVTIGNYTTVYCNVTLRGRDNCIGNYVHIYDNVCIESGRGAGHGTAIRTERCIIEDKAWINHGAVLHGCEVGKGAVVGLNAALDYNCKIGDGAIVANGSACHVGTVIPCNSLVEGVPAKVIKENLTDQDRLELLGLIPSKLAEIMAEVTVKIIKAKKGL